MVSLNYAYFLSLFSVSSCRCTETRFSASCTNYDKATFRPIVIPSRCRQKHNVITFEHKQHMCVHCLIENLDEPLPSSGERRAVGNARCLHIARLQRLVKKSSGSSRDFGSSSSRQLITFDAFSTEKHVILFLGRCAGGAARPLSGRTLETLFQQRSRIAPDDTSQTPVEPDQTKRES